MSRTLRRGVGIRCWNTWHKQNAKKTLLAASCVWNTQIFKESSGDTVICFASSKRKKECIKFILMIQVSLDNFHFNHFSIWSRFIGSISVLVFSACFCATSNACFAIWSSTKSQFQMKSLYSKDNKKGRKFEASTIPSWWKRDASYRHTLSSLLSNSLQQTCLLLLGDYVLLLLIELLTEVLKIAFQACNLFLCLWQVRFHILYFLLLSHRGVVNWKRKQKTESVKCIHCIAIRFVSFHFVSKRRGAQQASCVGLAAKYLSYWFLLLLISCQRFQVCLYPVLCSYKCLCQYKNIRCQSVQVSRHNIESTALVQ